MNDDDNIKTQLAVLQTDMGYVKAGIDEIKKSLKSGDDRMDAMEQDVTRLKEQNSIMGKLVNYVVPFVTGLGGVLLGKYG